MYLSEMKSKDSIEIILIKLRDRGIKLGYFLKQIEMSRSHFYFVRKGERVLTQHYKDKINEILNTNF